MNEEEKQARRDRRNERAKKKREQANLKKYRPKMPRKIVPIPNKDKGAWVESWSVPKNRHIGLFPHPTRIIFTGNTGMGKTTAALNTFLQVQASRRPFRDLHIVCCDVNSQEWVDCEPTTISEELPDLDLFDRKKKTLLVIDDFDMTKLSKQQQKRLSKLFRYASTHLNLSIYMSYQSTFHIPAIARRCANVWCVWRPTSDTELKLIADRSGVSSDDMVDIFENICSNFRDFLTIDLTAGTPCKLRKNLFEPIVEEEYSDSDD